MEALLTHCADVLPLHGNMFLAFFIGGLTGGFTHCLAMCGPLVAGQSACAGSCNKPAATASQWSYHLGRLTTYGALGFMVALLARQVANLSFWPTLSSTMLVIAGLMFISSSLQQHKRPMCHISAKTNYLRGAFMGFMPCGLLYAALMMAATLTHPLAGMVAMWMFTLGTIPALLIASSGATLLARKWQHPIQNIGRVMMALNGMTLLVTAAGGIR